MRTFHIRTHNITPKRNALAAPKFISSCRFVMSPFVVTQQPKRERERERMSQSGRKKFQHMMFWGLMAKFRNYRWESSSEKCVEWWTDRVCTIRADRMVAIYHPHKHGTGALVLNPAAVCSHRCGHIICDVLADCPNDYSRVDHIVMLARSSLVTAFQVNINARCTQRRRCRFVVPDRLILVWFESVDCGPLASPVNVLWVFTCRWCKASNWDAFVWCVLWIMHATAYAGCCVLVGRRLMCCWIECLHCSGRCAVRLFVCVCAHFDVMPCAIVDWIIVRSFDNAAGPNRTTQYVNCRSWMITGYASYVMFNV